MPHRNRFQRLFLSRTPSAYLLRDEFTTARAAGSVNGTAAEPGPGGTRNVTDTESKISITSGAVAYSAGKTVASNTDPLLRFATSFPRAVGVILVGAVSATVYSATRAGFGTSSGQLGPVFEFPFRSFSAGSAQPNFMALSNGTAYLYAIGCRASGEWWFVKGGIYTNWTLVWITSADTTSPLYIGNSVNNGSNIRFDYMRVFFSFAPQPLASDSFASAFATTDGLGHAEGIAGGIGSGGNGVTWTQQVGTWTVASGKASASALSGGIAIATVPLSTADVLADIKVTRSAGQGGFVLRYTDANNYLYANHDGTNAFLKQVLSGSTTTLVTAFATYSAGAVLRCDVSGVNGRLYYNNAFVGTTASINAGLTATAHGVYVTDVTANLTLDDFLVYNKGTGNEYAILDTF